MTKWQKFLAKRLSNFSFGKNKNKGTYIQKLYYLFISIKILAATTIYIAQRLTKTTASKSLKESLLNLSLYIPIRDFFDFFFCIYKPRASLIKVASLNEVKSSGRPKRTEITEILVFQFILFHFVSVRSKITETKNCSMV